MALPIEQIFEAYPGIITSSYGKRKVPTKGASEYHTGADVAAPLGTGVRSLASGKVKHVGYDEKSGHYIVVDHGKGYTTHYSHLQEAPTFKVGFDINEGDVIGKVGSTGISTGPHTHASLKRHGIPLNIQKAGDIQTFVGRQSNNTVNANQLLSQPNVAEQPKENREISLSTQNQNTNTMAAPSNSGIQVLLQATGKKNINEVTSQDIMKMASGLGVTETDIKRAIKGFDTFKQKGNKDITLDRESGTFEVTGPNQGIVAQSKRGAGNVKGFDIGDVVGAGRNVNYLANILAKWSPATTTATATNTEPTKRFTTPIAEPTIKYDLTVPKSRFRQPRETEQTDNTETTPVTEIPEYLRRQPFIEGKPFSFDIDKILHEGFNLEGGAKKAKTPNGVYQPTKTNKFERLAAISNPYAHQQYLAKTAADTFLKLKEENPNASEEELNKLAFDRVLASEANLNTEAMLDALGIVLTGRTLTGLPGMIRNIPKNAKSIYQSARGIFSAAPKAAQAAPKAAEAATQTAKAAQKLLPEPKISRMSRERGVPYNPSSGQTYSMPSSQPKATPKELLRLPEAKPSVQTQKPITGTPVTKTKTEIRREIASDKYGKKVSAESRKKIAQEKYGRARQKAIDEASARMGEEGGMHMKKKGGTIGARDLMKRPVNDMGLPKYQTDGVISVDKDIEALRARPEFQMPTISSDGNIPDYNFTETPEILETTGKKSIRDWFKNLRGGTDNEKDFRSGSKSADWKDIAETAALGIAPIAAQKYLKMAKVEPVKYRPIELGALAPKDLPKPTLLNLQPSTRNLSSDVRANQATEKFAEAQNRGLMADWNYKNAMQKRAAESAGIDASNRAKMFNAQLAMSNLGRNQYLDFQREYYNKQKLNEGVQSAFGNVVDKMNWNKYANVQNQAALTSDILKNPDSYPKDVVEAARKKVMTGFGAKGMKLSASNLLKK